MSGDELRPLARIEGIQLKEISGLRDQLRVGSCEELVSLAIALGKDAHRQIAEAVNVSEERARDLIELARSVIPPDVLAGLEQPLPYDEMPFGARHPDERKGKQTEEKDSAPLGGGYESSS